MKETIEYYYNLNVDDLEEFDGKYHFKIENSDFFFVFFNRNVDELDDIIKVSFNMREKGIDINSILLNINNSYLTKVNGYDYILFTVTNMYEKYDIFDMVSMANNLILTEESTKLYRNNWGNLWSQKIDYFEYQVRELALQKDVIKSSFSYYIGLAEIAISYVNNTNLKFGKVTPSRVVLSHRRIFYPNYKLNYLNPLSFIFDLEVRDIAEYLKSMFFKEDLEEVIEELRSYLKIKPLNIYEYQMLLARLIYPTFYFDIYEEVMNKDVSEEELIKIINRSDEYELFLKKAYLEISKYAMIDKIDFLTN